MPTFENLDLRDGLRRTLVSLMNALRMKPPKDVAAFEHKRAFVRKYVDESLRPHLKGTEAFDSGRIEQGYLAGIRFGDVENLQAGIAQKLLGVYEVELTDALKQIDSRKYDWIVNIGAAEGLYSIAFSRKWRDIPIYSFEQDFCTRQLLRSVITLNGAKSVVVRGEFRLEHLRALSDDGNGLIFSDCEGFERLLFSTETIQYFKGHDLVIETHDHLVDGVHTNVKDTLTNSHNVKEIDQLSLENRSARVEDDEFKKLENTIQCAILNEDRHPKNRWLIALR